MHWVVNLDKPGGMTSQQAVSRVKRLLGAGKAGHAGTLDPMATGVLLVCTGEATKITSLLMDMPKTYEAVLRLGQRTDTLDAEGRVTEERQVDELDPPQIERALETFRGEISQTPPMYSAIKQQGTPLYKLARLGVEVERKERKVTIYGLEAISYEHPHLGIRVRCSKGTYVRTLAEDIAEKLGTVAHLSALRRTRAGGFLVEDSVTFEKLEASGGQTAGPWSVTIDEALAELGTITLSPEDYDRMRNGGFADPAAYGAGDTSGPIRLKGPEGNLFALGRVGNGRIKVERMLHLNGQT